MQDMKQEVVSISNVKAKEVYKQIHLYQKQGFKVQCFQLVEGNLILVIEKDIKVRLTEISKKI